MRALPHLVPLTVLGLTVACTATPDGADNSGTLLQVRMALHAEPGITALRYEATPVDCNSGAVLGTAQTKQQTLLDFGLPKVNGLPDLSGDDAEHPFTDGMFLLEPGCYDVTATPLDENGNPSSRCAPAEQKLVLVQANVTNEILLVSQCNGRFNGLVDGVGVVNHPPQIQSVSLEPSAFATCGKAQRLCAKLTDVDGDPLEFVWKASPNNPSPATPLVVTQTVTGNDTTECVELVPRADGDYQVALTVFDRGYSQGAWMRIEDILAKQKTPQPSRYETNLAFHASCKVGTLYTTMQYTSQNSSQYCAEVTVTNDTSAAVTQWTAELTFTDSKLNKNSGSGAVFTGATSPITAKAPGSSAPLAAGASTKFSFCASVTGPSPSVNVTSIK